MKQVKLIVVLGISTALSTVMGCGTKTKTSDGEESQKLYNLVYTDVMEFVRGVESSYQINGQFLHDTTSEISIDGLPAGAVLEAGLLTWLPSCELTIENGQFMHGYQIYRLRINLKGLDSENVVQKPALIVLHRDGEGSPCAD